MAKTAFFKAILKFCTTNKIFVKRKEKNEALKQVNPIVVNKSSIDLSNGVKELLAKGLNFVPTPK